MMNRLRRATSIVGFILCVGLIGFALWGEALLATDHPLIKNPWLRNLCILAACAVFIATIWGFVDDIKTNRQKLKNYEND